MRSNQSDIELTVTSKARSSLCEVKVYSDPFSISNQSRKELREKIKSLYLKSKFHEICSIKGRFVIVVDDFRLGNTIIINDFFGSIPLYFTKKEGYIFIANQLAAFKSKDKTRLNLFQTYYQKTFQKKFLKETFLKDIFLIAGNSVLTINHDTLEYTFDDKKKVFRADNECDFSVAKCISTYEDKLISSILDKTSRDAVLTLSGGLDSSVLLKLTPKDSIKYIHSLCTISSIDNQEIDRVIELSGIHNLEHEIYPFNYDAKVDLLNWNESVIASMNPHASVETYQKYLIAKMIHQKWNNKYAVITGIGSDHFNGGHTMTDYNRGVLNNSWFDFLVNLKAEVFQQDQDYCELLAHLEYIGKDKIPWLKYLEYKHNGMMSGSLLSEFSTESYFGLQYICPFLDEDIVEFLASIPSAHYEELFFNKSILRSIGNKYLPSSFYNTQKVKPNNNLVYALRRFYQKIVQENSTQIANKIENSELLNNTINTSNLIYLLSNLDRVQVSSSLFYNIFLIYNFTLLGDYVNDPDSQSNIETKISFQSTKNISSLKKRVNYEDFHLNINSKFILSETIELVESNEILYLIQEDQVLKRVKNAYLKLIIQNLVSDKTLKQILDELSILWKEVEEDFSELYAQGVIVKVTIVE